MVTNEMFILLSAIWDFYFSAESTVPHMGFRVFSDDITARFKLCFRALAGAEPETDARRAALSYITTMQCFQPHNVYFRFQTFKYT